MVHHGDYLHRRDDHTLCGLALASPTPLSHPAAPEELCADCEAKLTEYHLAWWRERALTLQAELDELRATYGAVAQNLEAAANREARAEPADVEPVSLLDHVRVELLALCRQCEEAVPYWRLKTAMQAFSDKLSGDERVLLAQEIGADGSLIRWCTTEVVTLGWQVSNSPVQGEAEEMWDAWTHDAYQTPKKNKWRLGRGRSQDAS
ncbi:hypothetical protein A5663_03405 [Mycobacterium sp. E740]|nr:hypothetical protein A5663_03405 [Mycobacterium sp. E740]